MHIVLTQLLSRKINLNIITNHIRLSKRNIWNNKMCELRVNKVEVKDLGKWRSEAKKLFKTSS